MIREILVEAKNKFKLQVLIKILVNNEYRTYKNKVPNRMHEFHNNSKIVSIGANEEGIATIFRIRDYDIKNGTSFKFNNLKEFEDILRKG